MSAVSDASVHSFITNDFVRCVTGGHLCTKSKGKAFSCAPCAKAKQKCEGVAWFGSVAGPSPKSEGGSSGSTEIVGALTDIVSVLRQMKNELESIWEVVDDRYNAEESVSESDSEEELVMDQEELAELAAEGSVFEGFRAWVVETGRYQWEREFPLPEVDKDGDKEETEEEEEEDEKEVAAE